MEIYILFSDFDLIQSSALWSVLWIICTQYTDILYFCTDAACFFRLDLYIIPNASLSVQRNCTEIFFLTYFLLWGLSGRPIEDRALLPRLEGSLRSGPRNRSKKESGRSTSLRSLCDAQFLSITTNWVSLGDRKMSNRNTSKLFIQYVAFCSSHVKCTLNMSTFCTVLFCFVLLMSVDHSSLHVKIRSLLKMNHGFTTIKTKKHGYFS